MSSPKGKAPGATARGRLTPWAWGAFLGLVTFAIYSRVSGLQFLFYDDDRYVTANPWVLGGLSWAGFRWALSTLSVANWHPLTWLSHMLDVELFGLNAGAHHLVNAGFHACNAALLFVVLVRMTGAPWRSGFVAALFAVHPLHVESVAWISERKDVLSTFFGLWMLWAYARYAERPGRLRLAAVAVGFALSLLAKPMWVTAPFLLLLLDVWPLRRLEAAGSAPTVTRLSRLILEKLPLVALSAASCVATLVAQKRGGALIPVEAIGLGPRLANAVVSYSTYLEKTAWPTSLAALYPYPKEGPSLWAVIGAGGVVAIITGVALALGRKRPWLAVGWLWFLGTLVPVIGLVQVGSQALADRYTYLPLVGLFLAVVWEAGERLQDASKIARTACFLGAVAVLVAFSLLTWRQIGYWTTQEELFRHTLAVTANNGRGELILSQAYGATKDFERALGPATRAVNLDSLNPRAHANLGFILYQLGHVDEAIGELQRAVALQPDYAEAHENLGIAYGKKGWMDPAMREMSLGATLRNQQGKP